MSYDKNFEKYTPEEDEEKSYPEKREYPKRNLRKSECGKIEIKSENVYITIVCDKEKKSDY